MSTDRNGANRRLVLHVRIGYDSLSITTPVSLLSNESLHEQVSLATFDQIFVFHEAMNGCKNLNIHKSLLRKCRYQPMEVKTRPGWSQLRRICTLC